MSNVERWLAPLTGAVSISVAVGIVGVYAYGARIPVAHHAEVRAQVAAPPEEVWPLLAEPELRARWAPGVARVARLDDVDGKPVWRELDAAGDRLDLVVESGAYPQLVLRSAKPEDSGVAGTWTWTLEPRPTGTRISVAADLSVDNQLFRAIWWLREGPEAGIRAELDALVGHLSPGPAGR